MQDPKKRKKKKLYTTILSTGIMTGGIATLVFAYQSGAAFHPSGKKQEIKKNQIVFSKNKDMTGQKKNKDKDNSRFLKENQKDQQGAQTQNDADYMFKNALTSQKNQIHLADSNVTQANNGSQTTDKNNYYNVTKDPSKADVVIDATNGDGNKNNTSSDSNQNNSNNNSNSDSDHNSNNNNSNNTNKDQDNTGSDTIPSDSAKDPQSAKENPTDALYPSKPFTGEIPTLSEDTEDGDNESVIIKQSDTNTNAILYKGQSVTAKDIYHSLDTYVYGKDKYTYVLGEKAYGSYIKIDSVSFDGAKTWKNKFPVEIPTDIKKDMMKIKVNYRLSEKKKWVTRIVDYEPKDTRVFLLSEKITKENTVISDDIILNKYDQNPEPGTKMNLFRLQSDFLGSGRLNALFPGWTEKGKSVSWFYEVKAGRHILEPAQMVALDKKYTVELKHFWMNEDYKVDDTAADSKLCYLQTLTDLDDQYDTLKIPKYIQAVDVDSDNDMSVDQLEVPDTVVYMNLKDSGMRVNDSYKVDEDNPCYTSTSEGILMNKSKSEIMSIPYHTTKLKVGKSVNKVVIEKKNQLTEIDLSELSKEQLTEIDYKKLNDCKIIVSDDNLISFIQENYKNIFENDGNTVAAVSDPKLTYTVKNQTIINKEGRMISALNVGSDMLNLTDQVTSIAAEALKEATDVSMLVMPANGNTVSFEQDALKASAVTEVQCYSKEQYDDVAKQIEDKKIPANIKVKMVSKSEEGNIYCEKSTESGEKTVLLSVPKDITEFDGNMTEEGTDKKVSIDQIANSAFSNCKNLKWVVLPESVKKIGYQCFRNCTNLEGLLINSKDEITIGDESLDRCSALRFAASNAKKGIIQNDYHPKVKDAHVNDTDIPQYFYILDGSEGYNEAFTTITGSETPISGYRMEDIGEGTRMLYGVDDEDQPWLALRSGKIVADHVKLSKYTKEIFHYAMSDTTSKSGTYDVNWSEIPVWAIDKGAFYQSDLGGDIQFNENMFMGELAMSGCDQISSIYLPGDNIRLGKNVFNNCKNLKNVEIEKMSDTSGIDAGIFNGCDNLRDIILKSEKAENLLQNDTNVPYQFNYGWTQEEEAEKLRIHIPEGSEITYIKGWRYIYAGFVAASDKSAYANMREQISLDYTDWETWEVPSEERIDEIQKEQLLESENRIRKMTGMDSVSEPTQLYLYHEADGMVTLADVPSVTEELNLGTQDMELPEGWYLDYVGTGAFKNAKNLKKLTIPDNMTGIETDMLKGVESDQIDLIFEAASPLELKLSTEGTAYEFGVSDEHLRIHVPGGSEKQYLRSWVFPLAGYQDLDAMRQAVKEENLNADEQQIDQIIAKQLLPIENRLRKMMDLDEIKSIEDLSCKDQLNLPDDKESDTEEQKMKNKKESTKDQTSTEKKEVTTEDQTSTENKTTTQKETTTEEKNTKKDENLADSDKESEDTTESKSEDAVEKTKESVERSSNMEEHKDDR